MATSGLGSGRHGFETRTGRFQKSAFLAIPHFPQLYIFSVLINFKLVMPKRGSQSTNKRKANSKRNKLAALGSTLHRES